MTCYGKNALWDAYANPMVPDWTIRRMEHQHYAKLRIAFLPLKTQLSFNRILSRAMFR